MMIIVHVCVNQLVRRRVNNADILNVMDNCIRKKRLQRPACDRLTASHHLTTTFLQHIDLNTWAHAEISFESPSTHIYIHGTHQPRLLPPSIKSILSHCDVSVGDVKSVKVA